MSDNKAITPAIRLPSRVDLEKIMTIPDEKSVTDINKVSKAGPKFVHLKDNDFYNGQAIVVMAAEIIPGTIPDQRTGEIYDYMRAICAIHPPERKATKEDIVILQTGAGEVARRLSDAIAANAFPVRGILHKHGRAWTID